MTPELRQGGGTQAAHPTIAPLPHSDRFRCGYCDRVFVVPSLARCCESRHEQED